MPAALRSQLLSGTTAVITVGALSMSAGTIAATSLPAGKVPTVADVTLAAQVLGFPDPLDDIMDTLQYANLYLFSIAEPPTTAFDRAGIIPDFLAAGFPIVTQYALNASDYLNQVGNYLLQDYDPQADVLPGALRALNWAALALPQNIGVFANQLLTGNVLNALATVQFALINPIQYAAYQILNLGLYELGGVGARAAAVVTAVADWVPGAIRSLADDVTVFTNAVSYALTASIQIAQFVGPIAGLAQFVHQVLGSNGNSEPGRTFPTIPDALINQTIGEGGFIITSPPNVIPPETVEAPSIRQKTTELRDALAEALATAVPDPEAPPFTIEGDFLDPQQSSIPTPWKPTPYFIPLFPTQAPVTAPLSAQAARAAQAEPNTQSKSSVEAEPNTQATSDTQAERTNSTRATAATSRAPRGSSSSR